MLKLIQRLAYFRQDEPVRGNLVDIRHVPIKDLTVFLDHFPHIGDYFVAMTRQFQLFDFCHFQGFRDVPSGEPFAKNAP